MTNTPITTKNASTKPQLVKTENKATQLAAKPSAAAPATVSSAAAKPAATATAKLAATTTTAKPAKKATEKADSSNRGRGRPKGSKNKSSIGRKIATKKTAAKAAPKIAAKAASTAQKATATAKATASKASSTGSLPNIDFSTTFAGGQHMTQAVTEYQQRGQEAAQKISDEIMGYANQSFSQTMEISKKFLECRTLSDVLEVQHYLLQRNLSSAFEKTSDLSDMMLNLANETAEPLNAALTDTLDATRKKFSA